jgi:PAS domain S-box-containing protein
MGSEEERQQGFTRSEVATGPQNLPFETIVETINDGILVCRIDGEIIYANPSMAAMLGYTREKMMGQMLFDFMEPQWAEKARENLRRRRDGVEEMFDHQFRHSEGHGVWALVSAKPLHNEKGEEWGSLVAIQDISRRKEAEDQVRQARDELEERVRERTLELLEANERLQKEVAVRREAEERALEASQAKSTFLANMSHELRTPLNGVIGYTELIQEELEFCADDPGSIPLESIGRDLERVHQSADHLLALINDVLDLSKVEAGRMNLHVSPVDLEQVIEEVVATVEPLARQADNRIEVDHGFTETLLSDQTKIKQILMNLAGNAVKFTEGGTITIRTRPATVGGRRGVQIDVVDTGTGIPEAEIERLFEPFTQADESLTRQHGGTGLGLTICKRFCEMLGGAVTADSTVGEGTTFSILLPTEQGASAGETSEVEDDGVRDRSRADERHHVDALDHKESGARVLIIDDDPAVHDLMRRFLEPQGARIFSAFSGAQGVGLAGDLQPDLILLDVMMPGQDGWSVLSELKSDSQLGEIPVVMVTMVDEKSIGFALGATDYLLKPVQRERIIKVLKVAKESGESAVNR